MAFDHFMILLLVFNFFPLSRPILEIGEFFQDLPNLVFFIEGFRSSKNQLRLSLQALPKTESRNSLAFQPCHAEIFIKCSNPKFLFKWTFSLTSHDFLFHQVTNLLMIKDVFFTKDWTFFIKLKNGFNPTIKM